MKRILVTVVLLLGAASIFAQAPKPDEKQTQPTLQQRLEQTCQSIKSGELANPQAQLADICRAYDDEQEKKKEQSKENMQFWSAKYCGAPWAPDSPQRAKLAQVLPKLLPTFQRQYAGEAAAFGKLEMYSGDIKTGVQAQLQALRREHPMTPDRVQHVRDMLTQYNVVLKGPLSH